MNSFSLISNCAEGLNDSQIRTALEQSLTDVRLNLKKVLLLPPDFTRFHSNAGRITWHLWDMLKNYCEVDIMPALGTHVPVTESEWKAMFGDIPFDRMIVHNWRTDVVKVGTVPGEYVSEISEGLVSDPIDVEVNKRLLDPLLRPHSLHWSGCAARGRRHGQPQQEHLCGLRRIVDDQLLPYAGRVLRP